MRALKAQNSIEFMTTYSFALLIITIAIAVLFLFLSIPKSIIPFQCSFLNGFSCTDVSMFTLPNTRSEELVVVATDTQPGIINISRFGAVLNRQGGTGYCIPSEVSDGQLTYCLANFTFQSYVSSIYYGNFNLSANYCTNSTSIVFASCAATSNYVYGGSFRVQPSLLNSKFPLNSIINSSPFTTFYVPIFINNTQPVATSAPFQQEIQFAPNNAMIDKYARSNLGNIRFFYGNQELSSWCELNCATSSGNNAIFWIRLPFAIQPYANAIIEMTFLSNSVNYDSIYAGESPNQTGIYGQYDNGQNVFDFYDNFAGNQLGTKWTGVTNNGGTITVSNGLRLECTGSCSTSLGNATIIANSAVSSTFSNFIAEAAMNIYGTANGGCVSGCGALVYLNMQGNMTIDPGNMLGMYSDIKTGSNLVGYGIDTYCNSTCVAARYYTWQPTAVSAPLSGSATQYNILDQQDFLTDGYFAWSPLNYPGYSAIFSNSISLPGTGAIYPQYGVQGIGLGSGSPASVSELNIMFVRIRAYPPAGIMPRFALSLGKNAPVQRMT